MTKLVVLLLLGLSLVFTAPVFAQSIDIQVPLIGQERNLSCESAAVRMVLAKFGKQVPEAEIFNSLPKHPNPYFGFRGNVDGPIFSYQDYGIYSHPISQALVRFGVGAQPYQGITQDFLKEKVLTGKPAIIWINGVNRGIKYETFEGQTFKLVKGEHTVVVTGYQNGSWILNDPWQKTGQSGVRNPTQYRVKNLDSIGWHHFDHMAVIVD